jgi:hypothetical protein
LSVNWQGVAGKSTNQAGVFGESENWQGISGHSKNQAGAVGTSDNFVGVWAETKTRAHPALFAKGPALAGRFEGDVEVTGDIRLVNADCAENFDVNELDSPDPGTVMVLAEEGILRPCQQAYDKRVTGVISGAGDYRPAVSSTSMMRSPTGDQSRCWARSTAKSTLPMALSRLATC